MEKLKVAQNITPLIYMSSDNGFPIVNSNMQDYFLMYCEYVITISLIYIYIYIGVLIKISLNYMYAS